jgi:hypothetical protein
MSIDTSYGTRLGSVAKNLLLLPYYEKLSENKSMPYIHVII